MTSQIFIDANIPIYTVGAPHPMKDPCAQIIQLVARQPQAFVTSAEVVQELAHYYLSKRRWAQGSDVVQQFIALMDGRIEAIYADDVQRATALVDQSTRLGARDLLHVAVMARLDCDTIISADRGFDTMASITRRDPLAFATWRATIANEYPNGS